MKLDKHLLLLFATAGMLPPVIFLSIDLFYDHPINWGRFGARLFTSVLTTVLISLAVVGIISWLQVKYPWKQGITKRLILEIILTTSAACLLLIFLTLLFLPIFPVEDLRASIFNWLIVAVIMNAVLVTLTEGIFFYRRWRHSTLAAERFEKESIIAQFENLKNQVNPHFLFNSLNILSSLIDHDRKMSKDFVDDLSQVYRYILQHKDEELVDLNTELNFIHSYCQLLKKRHVDGIYFHFNIMEEKLHLYLPPMSLQMLIENAVKHNIVSKKRPLTIDVFDQDEFLIVRNNLQEKSPTNSSQIGLKNIQSRYRYLSSRNLMINRDENHFEVQLPLLKYQPDEFS